jgi:pimeloyl-ACP methyl ester carboxylesterase
VSPVSTPIPASAFYLQPDSDPVFALFHEAAQGRPDATAVLICPPFGWDDICSYRPRRTWAEYLAEAGHPTLRFDFPGTGDSSGSPRDPDRVQAWSKAVVSATSWLRERTGRRRVAAIGMGLGGLMASKAVADGASIDEIVLWAAAARGASFVRETRAFALMEDTDASDLDTQRLDLLPEGFMWAGGFVLSAETAVALGQLDLTELSFPPSSSLSRALLLDRDGIGPDPRLRAYLESQDVEVAVAPGPGYGALGPMPHKAVPPLEVFSRVLEWLDKDGPTAGAVTSIDQPADSRPIGRPADPNASPVSAPAVEMTVEDSVIRETPITIAQPFGELFGILAEPTDSPPPGPCLVMLNSGAIRRVGPNRMWVEFCRHWAAKGIPTLRLDLEGIGDSDGDAARITRLYPSVMYTEERIGQAIAAVDMLEQRGLGNRFILAGLCSGAYWSFHAAGRDERVSAAFLINPRILFWDRLIETERKNRRRVLRTSQWPRVLRGEVALTRAISLAGHALVMTPRQALAGKRARQSRSAALDGALDHLRDTDKNVQVFFSGDEPLREELEIEKRLSHLEPWPNVCVHYLPGSVHTLRPFVAQLSATDMFNRAIGEEIRRVSTPGAGSSAVSMVDRP